MSLFDLFASGVASVFLLIVWAVGLIIAGFLLYSVLVYIACIIPSVPMEHKKKNIYWRGELKHESEDDDLSDNGLILIGTILFWLGIIICSFIFIGYVANQLGVSPV